MLLGIHRAGAARRKPFPVRWSDNPAHSQDREVYPGHAGKVRYEEGVFVGYRHYDKLGIAPLFPFGFGLGYTEFALSDLVLDESAFEREGRLTVTATVTNTGRRAGSTVVQVYVGDADASVPRPARELKEFDKVMLEPGERRTVSFTLEPRAFAFYSVAIKQWLVEPGRFRISVGFSVADLPLSASVSKHEAMTLAV